MCIISRKALNAKNSQIEKLSKEKLKLENNYEELLNRYYHCKEMILEQEKTILEQEMVINKLTPVRDSKGRYCKRS